MNEKEEYDLRVEFGNKVAEFTFNKITYAEFENWFIKKFKKE